MQHFENRSAAIIDLQERGYNMDFILKNEFILCLQDKELISPDDFEITETYQFDGEKRPGENHVIYAIYAIHSGLKGILMASYSAFNGGVSIHLWSKLSGRLRARPKHVIV
jgi:hypothetical protein